MSANGIGALERGDRRTPQRETLGLLAKALALDAAQREEFERAAARPSLPRETESGASIAHGPWRETTSSDLPLSLTRFIGRERALTEIAALVRENRLVTLTGTGGIGKTRTASEVAGALRKHRGADIRLVELAPLSDASQVTATIAGALGAQPTPGRALLEMLIAYLQRKTVLLLVDNCEHLIGEVARVLEALLRSCPDLRVLATSRERLQISGEHVYRLPSLDVPSPEAASRLPATKVSQTEAIALFVDRARTVEHDFVLREDDIPVVADICRGLDGIPLAIELAAARVTILPLSALAKKLDERFALLTDGGRNVLPRQQTMRATIDWSVALLSEVERALLPRLAIFSGGWTLEAAEAVCWDENLQPIGIFKCLTSLVEKSLLTLRFSAEFPMVRRDGRASANRWPRYGLLESIRAYALEELEASGEREYLARRHAEWAADYGEWLEEFFFYEPTRLHSEAAFPDVHEMANRQEALLWALASDDALLAARIAGTWPWFDLTTDIDRRIQMALTRIEGTGHRALEARLWLALGSETGEKRRAVPEGAQKAISIFEECGERSHWLAGAFGTAASRSMEAGRYSDALKACDAELEVRDELGANDAFWRSGWLAMRGQALQALGRHQEAHDCLTEAIALSEFRLRWLIGVSILAGVTAEMGDFHRAAALGDEVMAAVPRHEWPLLEGHERWALTENRTNAVAYQLTLGNVEAARFAALDALELSQQRWGGIAPLTHLSLSTLGALGGDAERSARLKGYVDAMYAMLGEVRQPTDERTYRFLIAALNERLTTQEIGRLAAEGAAFSETQAANVAAAIARRLRPLS